MSKDFGGQGIGYEDSLPDYCRNLFAIFHECQRVLHPRGILWLELGDAYAGSTKPRPNGYSSEWYALSDAERKLIRGRARHPATTEYAPAKSLLLIPERMKSLLLSDGWLFRSRIIWDKGSPRPDRVKDRPFASHSEIIMATKTAAYDYDNDAVREPFSRPPRRVRNATRHSFNPMGRDLGTVWYYAPARYKGKHRATFPTQLVCRILKLSALQPHECVLDPFGGAGTVALVALQLGYRAITIDINPAFTEEARERLANAPADYPYADEAADASNDNHNAEAAD